MDIVLGFITGAAITLLMVLVYRAQQKMNEEEIKVEIEIIKHEMVEDEKERKTKNIADEVKRTLNRQGVV